MLNKLSVIFTLLVLSVFICPATNTNASGACTESHLAAQEEFGPLQIAILDLESIEDLLDEGNKKTAVEILKSAAGQLRKIKELTPRMVKGMGARLKKAIKSIKKGDNEAALEEVNHVLSELKAL